MAEPDEDDACIHAESLAPRLLLRHGAAGAADVTAAAYDACQQTLALALSNGSVQLFRGAGGAQECTLASGCTAPTLALHFLRQSPYLLRVSVQSDIELWDLRTLTLEASTLWAGDVTAACVLPGSPFVLLGEADGALRCACLRNGAVTPRDFEQSYGADCGALVALALQPEAEDGRVLVAHSSGRVSILDLATRDTVLLGACGSELTCCAWADTMTFLTGHASGALRFWSLPEVARGWRAPPQQPEAAVQSGELLCDEIEQLTSAHTTVFALSGGVAFAVRPRSSEGPASMVALAPMPGGCGALVFSDASVLLGRSASQSSHAPSLFTLSLAQPGDAAWTHLQLGFPAATVTCAKVVSSQCVGALAGVQHGGDSDGGVTSRLLQPAPRDGTLLGAARLVATGHADGAVRLCDASSGGLPVLATLSADAHVLCLDLCPSAALCAACTAGELVVFAVDGAPAECGRAVLAVEPSSVALCTAAAVAAVGGVDGSVTLLQLPACSAPKLLQPLPRDEAALALLSADSAAAGPLLLVLGAASSVAVVRCATGELVACCKPKTPSAGVAIFALDDVGVPVLAAGAPLPGHPRTPPPAAEDENSFTSQPGPAASVVVCSSQAARVYALVTLLRGERTTECKLAFRTPVAHAALFLAPGGACLACLDRALTLQVLEAARLRPVMQVALSDAMGAPWAGDAATFFACSLDGHCLSMWRDSRGEPLLQLHRLELLDEFSAPEPPPELPAMWERERALADAEAQAEASDAQAEEEEEEEDGDTKRKGLFGGKLGGLRETMARRAKAALVRVGAPGFKQRRLLRPADLDALFAPSPVPPPPPQSPSAAATRGRADDAAARGELLGAGGGGGAGSLRSVDAIRERYGRPARPADCASAMGDNLVKLGERGEKLSNIQEKTSRLEMQAADFAANAKKLREQQEPGNFFGLFS